MEGRARMISVPGVAPRVVVIVDHELYTALVKVAYVAGEMIVTMVQGAVPRRVKAHAEALWSCIEKVATEVGGIVEIGVRGECSPEDADRLIDEAITRYPDSMLLREGRL